MPTETPALAGVVPTVVAVPASISAPSASFAIFFIIISVLNSVPSA
jgi:hypothetical protein